MPILNVTVANKIATTTDRTKIVCDNSDYYVQFAFDGEWDAYPQKRLLVSYNGRTEPHIFTGVTAQLPPIHNAAFVEIGVAAGNIRTSTGALFECEQSVNGDNCFDSGINAEQYNEIMEILAAIPAGGEEGQVLAKSEDGDYKTEWVDQQGGGGGTSDHRQLTHRDAADQHPISAITNLQATLDEKANTGDIPAPYDDTALKSRVTAIEDVIPSDASAQNPLLTENDLPTPYILPQATATTLGGVKASPAQSGDTQPVRINADGELVTAPSGGSGAVSSVNGKTGAVVLTSEDVNALPDDTPLFSGDYDDLTNKPAIPSALSDLSADATHRTVTDAEKAVWNAKSDFSGDYNDLENKPTPYTLPQASSTALGGIKADPAQAGDTQPVRAGTDGKLVAPPEIFFAEVGDGTAGSGTTNAEIWAAAQAGKMVVAVERNGDTQFSYYRCQQAMPAYAEFAGIWSQSIGHENYEVEDDTWTYVWTDLNEKTTVTISPADWSGTTATKSVTGVTATNLVQVSPAPASISAWIDSGVYCSAQGNGTLTFTCSTVPTAAITVNIVIWR